MVGDIMLDRGVARSVNNNFDGDFSKVFENVSELKQTDITFGNLEGPITTSTNKRGSIYSFKMEPSVAGVLSNAGFDIISFANNHVGDYGQEGFEDTLKYLNENNILAAGAGLNIEDTSLARIITVRGKKIGFLGFTDVGPDWMAATEKSPGVILASNPNMEKIISTEKEKVDYLVVSFHWGIEYKPVNDRQRELATKAVSAGADVVVGHHPHVIQDDIVINGKPVLFSLGNFVFDQTTPPQTKVGMVAVVTLNTDGTISLDRFSSERDSTFRPSSFRLFKDSDAVLEQKKEIVFTHKYLQKEKQFYR
jgi:poly-gamma-glutamate synthesis protein (capsule biosynthesis protein)